MSIFKTSGTLDFQIDEHTFGLYQNLDPNALIGYAMGEMGADTQNPMAAVEHWLLLPNYQVPCFNLGGPDTFVTIRPIKPSAISASLAQYDATCEVPAALFVSTVRALHPGALYLKATVQRIP